MSLFPAKICLHRFLGVSDLYYGTLIGQEVLSVLLCALSVQGKVTILSMIFLERSLSACLHNMAVGGDPKTF